MKALHLVPLILASLLALSCSRYPAETPALAAGESAAQPSAVVAEVSGKKITLASITPPKRQMEEFKKANPGAADDEILFQARAAALKNIILTAVLGRFVQENNIKVTEEDVESYGKAMDKYRDEKGMEKRQMPAAQQRQMYTHLIGAWKTNKALYEKFGGTVILNMFFFREAVGATRKLLETSEARGDFAIHDPEMKKAFWEYYTQEFPSEAVKDGADFAEPWWLMDPMGDEEL